jgi:ribosomal protein S27AE
MEDKKEKNGTVTDPETGLMWQQWTEKKTYTWDEAHEYCRNLELAGHKDWRLPTVKELFGLIEHDRSRPTIDVGFFPGTKSSYYWSITPYDSYTSHAWFVCFLVGRVSHYSKSGTIYVRAVRNLTNICPRCKSINVTILKNHWMECGNCGYIFEILKREDLRK